MTETEVIDTHVHIAALPDGENGCLLAEAMRQSLIFRFVGWRLGLPLEEPKRANALYIERLVRQLRTAQYVRRAVILAMDGVYDQEGNLDRAHTEFLIPNDLIFNLVSQYPDLFLAGVSINPQRKDAIVELERCAKRGAHLVKVVPNSQRFDPGYPAYTPFYQAMARLKMPLLCHVGYEFTLRGKDQSLGDPSHLNVALNQGVTVIAAHGMSHGLFFKEKYWNTFQAFVKRYPHFYWDASALSLPNRVGMLLRIRYHPELHTRMIFGTDYPLPSFAFPALLAGNFALFWKLRRTANSFDRHYLLVRTLLQPSTA